MSDFNEDDWHLDITSKTPAEAEFLDSGFPKEFELVEWVDDEPSKIDKDYFDIAWTLAPDGIPRGMLIAFMHKDTYKRAFADIGKPADELDSMRVVLTVAKHDEPADRKSHPQFKCWLEITDAKFIEWVPDEDDDDFDEDDDFEE